MGIDSIVQNVFYETGLCNEWSNRSKISIIKFWEFFFNTNINLTILIAKYQLNSLSYTNAQCNCSFSK